MHKELSELFGIVALKKGIDEKIWEMDNPPRYLLTYWISHGLMEGDNSLTDKGTKMISCKALLDYEFIMIREHLSEGPVETKPENYTLLRKGLAQYYEAYIEENYKDFIKKVFNTQSPNKDFSICDYGGGAGQYAISILDSLPSRVKDATVMDRKPQCGDDRVLNLECQIDDLSDIRDNKFDIILINEVLHCMSIDECTRTLLKATRMLKPGGYIVVGEQVYNSRLQWRMAILSKGGNIYDSPEVTQMISQTNQVNLLDKREIKISTAPEAFMINNCSSHWFAAFRREF